MASITELRQGDRLPTVGILQKLLNRTGANLKADGIFGRKTHDAVAAFQTLRGLPGSGDVDLSTWKRLVFTSPLPIVDVVDVFDPMLYGGDAKNIMNAGGDPLLIGGMSLGVQQLATDLLLRARSVFLLRINAHGRPGVQAIGHGAGGWDEMQGDKKVWHRLKEDSFSAIHYKNVHLIHTLKLKGIFGPYGNLELHGCRVAKGDRGHDFVKTLARQLKVPVTAGTHEQFSTFHYDGPTFTAFPKGTLSDWCASLPDFPSMSIP